MEDIKKLEFVFQTLADSNRLRILRHIGKNTCSVSEIVAATGLSQPLVSHHLKILRERAILETKRKGPFILYALKDERILDALGIFTEITANITNTHFDRRAFHCPKWFRKQ